MRATRVSSATPSSRLARRCLFGRSAPTRCRNLFFPLLASTSATTASWRRRAARGGGTRDRAACTRASSSLHSNARRPATDERDDHPARDQGRRDGRDASSQRAPRGRLRPRRADPDVRRGGSRHAHERRCVHFGARRVRFPHPPVSPVSSPLRPRPRLPSPSPFPSPTAAAAATVATR